MNKICFKMSKDTCKLHILLFFKTLRHPNMLSPLFYPLHCSPWHKTVNSGRFLSADVAMSGFSWARQFKKHDKKL